MRQSDTRSTGAARNPIESEIDRQLRRIRRALAKDRRARGIPPPPKETFTFAQAAKKYGCTVDELVRMRRIGLLLSFTMGGRVYTTRSEMDREFRFPTSAPPKERRRVIARALAKRTRPNKNRC